MDNIYSDKLILKVAGYLTQHRKNRCFKTYVIISEIKGLINYLGFSLEDL